MATKSLGTLTVDLIAKTSGFVQGMDKAERESSKRLRKIKKNIASTSAALAKFGAIAGTAVAAGFAKIAKDTIDAGKEISRFSKLANAGTTEFQKFAAAASRVGIENEKVADILKDVNDKVGDFLQTGGGPLADFFENIAPQVGVTAEQFRNLSGPQALGLYVDSLQKANLSQSELTFFLEAIANDATLLLPLLRDNGKQLKEFGDQAERAGGILDRELIEQAVEVDKKFRQLGIQFDGVKVKIARNLLPAIEDLVDELTDENTIQNASQIFVKIAEAIPPAVNWVISLVDKLGDLKEAVRFELFGADPGNLEQLNEELDEVERKLGRVFQFNKDELRERQAELQSLIAGNLAGFFDEQETFEVAKRFLEPVKKATQEVGDAAKEAGDKAAEGLDKAKESAQDVSDTVKQWVEEQNRYSSLVKELRTDEERINDTLRERLAIIDEADEKLFGADKDEQRKRAAEAAFGQLSSNAPSFGGLDAVVGGPASELNRIDQSRAALEEWYQEQLDLLEQFRQDRSDLSEVWNEREVALTREREEKIAQIEQARQLASLSAAEDLFGNLADVAKQFAGEQSEAYRVLFAIEKGAAIARSIVAIQGALAQAANAPFPANIAAMATVAAQTAGIISTIQSTSIQGQAHDGLMSVPKTGTYLLEKGERVTTAETSAKLDQKLDGMGGGGVRIINSIDPSLMNDFLGSSQGEKTIMNVIRKNQRTISALSFA